ncbi:hypothetical protein EGW08_021204 [Elysia chlorotica]|uniref:Uncharacterized protein n=1 Tax=Elysia chlorotica TaxID=188477 RepID=A0A3S1B3F8_ELYCH|nr:hypothetical protein EGW08_021204 [Elysia chlorotica]
MSLGFSEIATDNAQTLLEKTMDMFNDLCDVYKTSILDVDIDDLLKEILKASQEAPGLEKGRGASDAEDFHLVLSSILNLYIYYDPTREDISRVLPHKRYSTRLGPAFVMNVTMLMAFRIFKEENPTTKVGYTKFTTLRPRNMRKAGYKCNAFNRCLYKQGGETRVPAEGRLLGFMLCPKPESSEWEKPECLKVYIYKSGGVGANTLTDGEKEEITLFLKGYAEDYALALPGRMQSSSARDEALLLPFLHTKQFVYDKYTNASQLIEKQPVESLEPKVRSKVARSQALYRLEKALPMNPAAGQETLKDLIRKHHHALLNVRVKQLLQQCKGGRQIICNVAQHLTSLKRADRASTRRLLSISRQHLYSLKMAKSNRNSFRKAAAAKRPV